MTSPLDRIRDDLQTAAESLADEAIELLSRAVHAEEHEQVALKNLERRVTRARRSVERAIVLLDGGE